MVKGLSIPEGQDLPEQKRGPEHAGEVFAEHYALALKSMHPEDALDHARDAAEKYLKGIGATRAWDGVTYTAKVEVTNVEQIAMAVCNEVKAALSSADEPHRYGKVVVYRVREDGVREVLARATVPGTSFGMSHYAYFVELEDDADGSAHEIAHRTAGRLAGGEAMRP